MKFTAAFGALLFGLIASASASQRTAGGPDGIYLTIVDSDGTTHLQYVGPTNTTAPYTSHAPTKRASVGPACQSGVRMSASDIVNAQNGLANFFGSGNAFSSKEVSSFSGGAVAFGCNYGNGQTMDSGTFGGFMDSVTATCGATTAGYYNHPDWKASYGRTLSSSSFC